MHTSLDEDLHTAKCVYFIRLYLQCHKDYPYLKYFGQCNDYDKAMKQCMREERKDRRHNNHAKVQENIKKYQQAKS